jgi:crossover junction endodeoxyribonuclease RusA
MSASTIEFTVPGRPAPQGSKRHVGRGILVESSKDLGPWRERVAIVGHEAMKRQGWPPFTGAVDVAMEFVMPRPKGTPRNTPPAVKRPDLDKLERAILDALTHVCWTDDSLVVRLQAWKRIALVEETPGVTVSIREARP